MEVRRGRPLAAAGAFVVSGALAAALFVAGPATTPGPVTRPEGDPFAGDPSVGALAPEHEGASLQAPVTHGATARATLGEAEEPRGARPTPWHGDAERRAASARALAAAAGLAPEDPLGASLLLWYEARPDAEAALRARDPLVVTRFNLDAARWRVALVALVGPGRARDVARVVPFVEIDPASRELLRVDLEGQPTAAPADWNRS